MDNKKNLTLRYSITQFVYWAPAAGAEGFGAVYLLNRGVPSGVVGTVLAAAGICSFLTQPFLASAVDSAKKFVIKKMLLFLMTLGSLCLGIQLIEQLPTLVMSLVYLIGIWCFKSMFPLLNALCVAYNQAGYFTDYGKGRGTGAVASALSSLVLGIVIAELGNTWMLVILVILSLMCVLVMGGYPSIETSKEAQEEKREESCSVLHFFVQYKRYCISLIGMAFLGMFLAMTEMYLIAILGKMGGDSSHVGITLFIDSVVIAPVLFFYDRLRKYIRESGFLKIAAVSFLIKSVLYYFAGSISMIYALQLFHITSYAFLAPTQVYYANRCVKKCDMAKGQAFSTATYALGCSLGTFLGGQLLNLGVEALLLAGIVMALVGTVLVFATVKRTES